MALRTLELGGGCRGESDPERIRMAGGGGVEVVISGVTVRLTMSLSLLLGLEVSVL